MTNELNEYFKKLYNGLEDKKIFVEIRCTPVNNYDTYKCLKSFADENNIYYNKKLSLFFSPEQYYLIELLLENEILKQEKVCYSVNPRMKYKGVDGKLSIETSGIDATPYCCAIPLDIEEKQKDADSISVDRKQKLFRYVQQVIERIKIQENLVDPTIIDSGAGYHLIYMITPQQMTDARRKWYREFINNVIETNKNDFFHIDSGVKDYTRVLGLPKSNNPKWNREVKIVLVSNTVNNFKIGSIKVKKQIDVVDSSIKNLTPEQIKEKILFSIEWFVLTHSPPEGERNNTICFAFKLLLKKYGVGNYEQFEQHLNKLYGDKWVLNPNQGTNGKNYSVGIIKNWIKKNQLWYDAMIEKYKPKLVET